MAVVEVVVLVAAAVVVVVVVVAVAVVVVVVVVVVVLVVVVVVLLRSNFTLLHLHSILLKKHQTPPRGPAAPFPLPALLHSPPPRSLRYQLTVPSPPKPTDAKLILFSDFPDYYELEGRQGPKGLAHCTIPGPKGQQTRCELTVDNRRFQQADAVLFYSHGKHHMNDLGFDPVKRPGSTWTFFAVESPIHSLNTLFNDAAFHNKFNSTMTYRTDSEFWHGYFRTQRRKPPASPEESRAEEIELRRVFRKKSKMAAVFVSNCGAPSRRDVYVRELQKHIPVDVYGNCGPLRCQDRKACDEMLNKDYKFYLAFENSLCYDYITEKLLKILSARRVVPVVRGGADYSRLAPKNSVVDTSKFSSIAHLAAHLKELAADEEKWIQMFQWSSSWEVKGPDLPFCEYCQHLYSAQRSSNLYSNVYQWWSKGTCYPVKDVPRSLIQGRLLSFVDNIRSLWA
ncbi:alpha-(1,3)-fucosyltransferase [Elysia marginata]|uniref:Fucosyltransferase n=1 Tax=Elysia marginata TaxID=1093978 RepID=A0AAV4FV89_9GAST|nr:alpha-(1,3)-fucosyltransferase [Elysia marginata]